MLHIDYIGNSKIHFSMVRYITSHRHTNARLWLAPIPLYLPTVDTQI